MNNETIYGVCAVWLTWVGSWVLLEAFLTLRVLRKYLTKKGDRLS